MAAQGRHDWFASDIEISKLISASLSSLVIASPERGEAISYPTALAIQKRPGKKPGRFYFASYFASLIK